jgi:outer membrane protein assembly factor BamB
LAAAGVVYFGSGSDGYLYAVDGQTGQELWKLKADEGVYSSPTIAAGVIYFGSDDNHLYAVR